TRSTEEFQRLCRMNGTLLDWNAFGPVGIDDPNCLVARVRPVAIPHRGCCESPAGPAEWSDPGARDHGPSRRGPAELIVVEPRRSARTGDRRITPGAWAGSAGGPERLPLPTAVGPRGWAGRLESIGSGPETPARIRFSGMGRASR